MYMQKQHRDTTYTKIFVGGLPYHTTDQSLRDFFSEFGAIDEAVVITDRQTGKSRGYGFVTMSDAGGADRACRDANPIIDGRKANVNLAHLGAKGRKMTCDQAESAPLIAELPGQIPPAAVPPQYPYMMGSPAAYLGAPIMPMAQQLMAQGIQLPASVSPTGKSSPDPSGVPGVHPAGGYAATYQYALAASQLAQFGGYPFAANMGVNPAAQQLMGLQEHQLRLIQQQQHQQQQQPQQQSLLGQIPETLS